MKRYVYSIDSDFSLYNLEEGIADILQNKNLAYTKTSVDLNYTSFNVTINKTVFNKSIELKILLKVINNKLELVFDYNSSNVFDRVDVILFGNGPILDVMKDVKRYVEKVINKEVYFDMNMRRRIIAATPIISLIIFLCMGYIFDMWGYGCIAFLLIPFMPIVLGEIDLDVLYPVIVCVIYISLGLGFGWWHPAWIMFLTIPVYYILFPAKYRKYIKKKYNYTNE